MTVYVLKLGIRDYSEIYDLQRSIVAKKLAGDMTDDVVLFLEHRSVFTLGIRGGKDHLTVSETFLVEKGIEIVHVERGGDITYHGPGQIVVYPVIDMKKHGFSVRNYVTGLEDIMLMTAGDFSVKARNDEINRGAWINDGKKLGSVGIAVKKTIAFHGLALNVNTDLTPFSWINPCGLDGVTITSIQRETGHQIDMESAYDRIIRNCETRFGTTFDPISLERLRKEL